MTDCGSAGKSAPGEQCTEEEDARPRAAGYEQEDGHAKGFDPSGLGDLPEDSEGLIIVLAAASNLHGADIRQGERVLSWDIWAIGSGLLGHREPLVTVNM